MVIKKKESKKEMSTQDIKKLYRSKQNKIIAGVCGGIGEYLQVDPLWIRLGAVLFFLANGIGLILYVIAWVIIPENPSQKEMKKTKSRSLAEKTTTSKTTDKNTTLLGFVLFLIGGVLLLQNILPWFTFNLVWPSLLILVGLYLLGRSTQK